MTKISQNMNETQSGKECETSLSTPRTRRQVKIAPYQWKPGQSGNPEGRPKGSKNKITALKLGIEEHLRDQLNLYMPEILQSAIELALKGDKTMMKVLLELCMSKAQAVEDTTDGKDKVKVTISNLTIEQEPKQSTEINDEQEAIDGRQLQ